MLWLTSCIILNSFFSQCREVALNLYESVFFYKSKFLSIALATVLNSDAEKGKMKWEAERQNLRTQKILK